MNKAITWIVESRPISSLKQNPNNPRVICKESIRGVRESIKRNGYTDRIICDKNGMILSGHARHIVLSDILKPDTPIEILVPNRKLTPDETQNVILGMNAQGGRWNIESLQLNFPSVKLQDFGIKVDIPDIKEVSPPEISEDRPDNNIMSLVLTNDEKEIVDRAIAEARDYLEMPDGHTKPTVAAIVAICEHFLALQEG